jgi:hypothetical protein
MGPVESDIVLSVLISTISLGFRVVVCLMLTLFSG